MQKDSFCQKRENNSRLLLLVSQAKDCSWTHDGQRRDLRVKQLANKRLVLGGVIGAASLGCDI